MQVFTVQLFQNVCCSLFDKDKLVFSFLLSSRILESEGRLDHAEFAYLLSGSTVRLRKWSAQETPTSSGSQTRRGAISSG